MLSYCLKRKKNTENINPKVSKTNNYQNVLCVVVKRQNLLKNKKQAKY